MNLLRISCGQPSRLFLSALICAATSALHAGCDGNGGGGGGGGGGGDGGGGGQSACEAFVTEPQVTAVKVRIANNTAADLFIGPETAGGCGETDPFSLQDANGEAVTWRLQNCNLTCEAAQTGACGCTADCQLPVVWRIAPAGVLEVEWSGTVFTTEKMPDGCYDEGCGVGQDCFVPREPSGALTFLASAWSETGGSCGGTCTCTPDAQGSCMIATGEATVAGTEATTSAQVTTLGGIVDIVFE